MFFVSGSRNDQCASCRCTICRVRLGMASDQITRLDVEHGCKLSGEGGICFRLACGTWKMMRVLLAGAWKRMRVVVAELGADLVRLTTLDASCLGEGLGMCVGSRGTWKKMRVLVAKVGAVLVRSTHLWVQAFWEADKDMFRQACGTRKVMQVRVTKVGLCQVETIGCKFSGRFSVGMRNTESDASVGHQSGNRPGQVDTIGCKLSGEGTGMFFGRHVEHGK